MSLLRVNDKIKDESLVNALIGFIQEGASESAACGAVGLHPMSYARWMQKGYNDPEGITEWGKFYLRVLKAKAIAEMVSTQKIAETKDWKGHAWLLERRNPEAWSEKQRAVEQAGGPSPEDVQALRQLSTEELEKALSSGHIAALLESKTVEVEAE